LESVTFSGLMVTDTYAPNFDTHEDRADITNEVTGDAYTVGGQALGATPTWTVGAPNAGQIAYDFANPTWLTSTISDAMGGVVFRSTGVAGNDELLSLNDFVTAGNSENGTFTWIVHADGAFYIDYTP
jgi:hypothetical protein